jgi:pimeloyl-ACP methyl ester carboxylesterase
MTEDMVRVNGVDLCVETFGHPDAPAILLISGAAASMDLWDAEFCRRLAAGGRFVIRYDHRDTGGIAQYLAVEHPDRVATLTLMSTSPGPADDLPPMADRLEAVLADPAPEPDWTDRDAVVEYLVAGERPFAGPDSFDEAYAREVARRVVGRTVNLESSAKNHWLLEGGEDVRPRLGEVTAPTLVIHGTEDPFFPPGHAFALAREIAGAELLLLDGVGHQAPPRSTWDLVVPAILRHTAP